MRKIWLVLRNEIRVTLRRKSFTIVAFGMPLLLGLIALGFGIFNRGAGAEELVEDLSAELAAVRNLGEGYVDPAGLIRALPPDIPPHWLRPFADETAAAQALAADAIAGYYVIDSAYVETGRLTYFTREYNPLGSTLATPLIRWVLTYNLLGQDLALAARVQQPLQLETQLLTPDEEGAAEESNWFSELLPNLLAITLYIVILLPAGILVNSMVDEKKHRVLEQLLLSASPLQILAGKIGALGILGLAQTAVWLGVLYGVAFFGGAALALPEGFRAPTGLIAWTMLYFLFGYGMYGAQMAGIGALATDLKDTKGVTFLVLSPLIAVYVLMAVIAERPNSLVAVILSFFPLTAPVGMLTRLAATELPLWQPALSALLQLAAVIVIIWLAARLFRARTLLSGQAVTVRTVWAALSER